MGFDMMALMNNKSKAQAAGAGKYELQKIPIDKMIPNPVNDEIYEAGEIDELAQSILLAGKVLQNAVVTPADENGNHVIIAGHRRRLACQKLVEDGHSEFGEIPCVVLGEQDNLMQELFLIQTNSTARVLTDAEKVRQAERATAILTELKDRKQISGRVRDIAAKMLGTTTGQLARYSAISKGLTNETLQEAFEDGRIGVSAAYEASRMDEKGQAALADKVEADGTASVRDVVEKQKEAELAQAIKETESSSATDAALLNDDVEKFRVYALAIKKKFKANVEIYWQEHAGKFYAGYQWSMTNSGGGCYPNPKYDHGYDTKQEAIEETIKSLAQNNTGLHEAIWGSGYALVGEPAAEESPAESKELVTDKTSHHNEEADTSDDEIEELRALWLRKRALDKVIESLKSTKDYYLLQADTGAGQENNTRVKANRLNTRVETSRLVAEIIGGYIRMAADEKKELGENLGDWEELFEQESHA
jgi:ParB family chromosome partitioning protein